MILDVLKMLLFLNEHPPVKGGKNVKTFIRWDHRLQRQNLFMFLLEEKSERIYLDLLGIHQSGGKKCQNIQRIGCQTQTNRGLH